MADPIEIVDYDESWPGTFELIRSKLESRLGNLAVAVEHVGSTAVPGLAAKPIVDIDVLLSDTATIAEAVGQLKGLGYRHLGDLGIKGREAFDSPKDLPVHHLYVCPDGSAEFQRHVAFRNYLRTHPEVASEYARLKSALAIQFRDDRVGYTEGKTAFVEETLQKCGDH